jgi:beta-glucanase (GH16 family)
VFNARIGGNGWGNGELQSYTDRSDNVALDGAGHLVIDAVRGSYTGADGYRRDWTSARLDTLDKWAFTTGTLTVRMRAPLAGGMWPAFWLLGTDIKSVGWPTCGEVDVVELVHGDGRVHQTVHGPTAGGPYAANAGRSAPALADPAAWHEYSITRRTGQLVFGVDGHVTGRVTRADLSPGQRWVFDGPMFPTLNLAVGGWSGAPGDATPDENRMEVDWLAFRR